MKKKLVIIFALFSQSLLAENGGSAQHYTQYILIGLVAVVLALLLIEIIRRSKRPEDTTVYKELLLKYDTKVKDFDHLQGKDDQLRQENAKLGLAVETKTANIYNLEKQLSEYKANETQRRINAERKISELENARRALVEERARVLQDERQDKEEEEKNRNRIWAIHEDNAKMHMKSICQKSDIALQSFDNNNLPEGFDTKLLPDFMIRLLNQYVIFDPKSSQSLNLQAYLKNQVQSTAKKIRQSDSFNDLYKSVFFIIPNIGLDELNETHFIEQGILFFIISLEAFEPIVRTLKRLEDYDLADKYDPQERENIVNVLAAYDHHIRQQNATNILTTLRGLQVLAEKETIPEDVADAVDARRAKLRIEQLGTANLKKLMENPEKQANEILALIEPNRPKIEADDLDDSAPLVT